MGNFPYAELQSLATLYSFYASYGNPSIIYGKANNAKNIKPITESITDSQGNEITGFKNSFTVGQDTICTNEDLTKIYKLE
jgi:hypothetical protein